MSAAGADAKTAFYGFLSRAYTAAGGRLLLKPGIELQAAEDGFMAAWDEQEKRIVALVAEREWRPISEAPKDGTPIRLANVYGEWIGKYVPVYQSGFKPENPWFSLMLNHEHMAKCCIVPTHFQPLSVAPTTTGDDHG